jgi:hypothetical protein
MSAAEIIASARTREGRIHRMVNSAGMVAADAQRAVTDAAEHDERTVRRPRFNGVSAVGLEFTIEEAS